MFRDYGDPQYKKWRKSIYSRDKYKCRWPNCCLKRKLNAHHIRKWADFPHLRFDINNGITLCKYHHDLIKGNEEIYETSFLRILANDRLQ
jgi:predicted restriction endonuclease